MIISYIGDQHGVGAYPTLNHHFEDALSQMEGVEVWENVIAYNNVNSDVAIVSAYPPQPRPEWANKAVALTTWEFSGERSLPRSWLPVLREYDAVWVFCKWAADIFRDNGLTNILGGRLGVDTDTFVHRPMQGGGRKVIGMAGGTDARHGIDVGLAIFQLLEKMQPGKFELRIKVNPSYPANVSEQPDGVIFVYDNYTPHELANFWNCCDVMLHPVRGSAPGLHLFEAIACGVPFVSTVCGAERELISSPAWENSMGIFMNGTTQPFEHHLHNDCEPHWLEPDPQLLAEGIIETCEIAQPKPINENMRQYLSWAAAAKKLLSDITGILNAD